jgi:hypothetical protein
MILVAGESLIDLIVDPAGGVRASLGGGPYNAARTMARLGAEVQFLGRVSADPFGSLLAGGLAQSGVRMDPSCGSVRALNFFHKLPSLSTRIYSISCWFQPQILNCSLKPVCSRTAP